MIIACNESGDLNIEDPARAADMVFIIVDGAYYYLSVVSNKAEYKRKLDYYKTQALQQLNAAVFEQV